MKILILYSGRLQISRHISLVATYPSARESAHILPLSWCAGVWLLLFSVSCGLPHFLYYSFLLIKMQPTDLTVAGCGVCMMLPGTILPPGMGVLFFLGYTSIIFRCGRNFSRPTVYCSFFKVGKLLPSLSSYCQPLPLRAAFMAATAVCQVTLWFFAALNNSCKSAGTLVLLLHICRHGKAQ